MKFAKYLTLLFLLCFLPARATIRTVCVSGCSNTTYAAALSASANHDTIAAHTAGGKNWAIASVLDFSAKTGIVMMSDFPATPDTLMGDNQVIKGGDSLAINNFVLSWTSDTVSASGRLFEANGKKRITFLNDKFRVNSQRGGNQKRFGRFIGNASVNSNTSDNHQFINCVFDSVDGEEYKDIISSRVNYDNCTFKAAFVGMGHRSHVRNCTFIQGNVSGGEPLSPLGTDDTIQYVYMNCGGLAGECFSSDEAKDSAQFNMVVNGFNAEKSTHVHLVVDHFQNSTVSFVTIHYNSVNGNFGPGAFYIHDNVATDTVNNLAFSNITFTGTNGTTSPVLTRAVVGNFNGQRLTWTKSVFQSTGPTIQASLSSDSIKNDTLSKCLFRGTAPISMGTWAFVAADTLRGVDPIFIQPSIDTVVRPYPYLKYRAVAVRSAIQAGGVYYGNKKHLINPAAASNITTTGFSVIDSVADDFWWDRPVEKDSLASLKLQTSTNGTVWTDQITKTNRRAGAIDTFAVTGLTSGTKYYFRLIGVGTGRTGALTDTTLSSSSVAFIDSVIITATAHKRRTNWLGLSTGF